MAETVRLRMSPPESKRRFAWSLAARLRLAFALPVLATLASTAVLYRSLDAEEANTRWLLHTVEVMSRASEAMKLATSAESEERGVLAGDRSAHLGFEQAVSGWVSQAGELQRLVDDNPEQVARVRRLRTAFAAWLGLAADAMSATPSEQAATVAASDAAFARVQALGKEVSGTEAGLLAERRETRTAATTWLRWFSLAGPGAAVLLACLAGLFASMRIERSARALAEAAGELARGNLERRAPLEGADELAVTARAFNRMAARLEERAAAERVLKRLRDLLQAAQSSGEVFAALEQLGPRLLSAPSGALFLMAPSRDILERAARWGAEGDEAAFTPSECWAVRRGRSFEGHATAGEVRCAHTRHAHAHCVPLAAQGESLGVLCLGYETAEAMAAVDPLRVEEVAEVLALAVANLRLRETLRNQAVRDALTGLFNRRYMEETLGRELVRAKRAGTPLSVLMLDVDHFKRFNDTHGHGAGDALLRELGGELARGFRASDVPCRYGGEEFIVICPEAGLKTCLEFAERVRKRVAQMQVRVDDKTLERVTISLGVASYPECAEDAAELVRAADAALYQSKHEGRDRVSAAPARALPGPEALAAR